MSRLCHTVVRQCVISSCRSPFYPRSTFLLTRFERPDLHKYPSRNLTTSNVAQQNQNLEGSFFRKALKSLGIGKYKFAKATLKRSGFSLFVCLDDLIDYTKFISELKLADTFYSYYIICELHVWMLMCRLTQEGEDGKIVKQALCAALWENIEMKSKKLGEAARSSSARKENIEAMGHHFNAALFNYDEGIVCDDKVLAAAVWRSVFHMEDVDPEILEKVVAYIRKQMKFLDEQDSRLLVRHGIINLLDLDSDTPDEAKLNQTISKVYET